jgi:hypothetical protein
MLGVNIDITPLLDQGSFQRYYAFKDTQKDKALEDIRNKENRYQPQNPKTPKPRSICF